MEDQQQEMERWARRGRFFRRTVILDFICPPLGVIGLVYLVISGSDSLPAFSACAGFLGVPWVGAAADALSQRRR